MLEPFHLPYVQSGLLEIAILSLPAGILGSWIVLRGLAFYSHAVGTAAYPGLVLAGGLGFSAPLGALGAAAAFGAVAGALGRRGRLGNDALTALALAGFLAVGVILASDVFRSGADTDQLLFGSLFLVGRDEIAIAGLAAAATLLASLTLGPRWLAAGFEGRAPGASTAVLLVLVALTAAAMIPVVGALLIGALFVVPAATVRLVTSRMRSWQVGAVALVLVEGTFGLWLSVRLNAPPGPVIATLASAVFALVALGRVIFGRLIIGRIRLRQSAMLVLIPLCAMAAAGCGGSGPGSGTAGDGGDAGGGAGDVAVTVVATTTQIADLAANVGGDRAEVVGILEANSDPHGFEPRPDDVAATAEAEVVLNNGRDLDPWAADLVEASGSDAELVDLSAGMGAPAETHEEDGHEETEGHSHDSELDPHWWHDPRKAIVAVDRIAKHLGALDPAGAAIYTRNAAAYTKELTRLDRAIARCIGQLPPDRRKLITDHEAFGHFAERYDLEVIGTVIPATTSQAQPSARDLRELTAAVERERVQAIFPESSLNSDLAETIASQTGAIAEYTLYGDSLGPEGSDGDTYAKMEAANARAIVAGLSGGDLRCESLPG